MTILRRIYTNQIKFLSKAVNQQLLQLVSACHRGYMRREIESRQGIGW
jgi:hypothetical protein